MKILMVHLRSAKFTTHSASTRPEKGAFRRSERAARGVYKKTLGVFVCVTRHDTVADINRANEVICQHAKTLGKPAIALIPFAHLDRDLMNPGDAWKCMQQVHAQVANCHPGSVYLEDFGFHRSLEIETYGHPLAVAFRDTQEVDSPHLHKRPSADRDARENHSNQTKSGPLVGVPDTSYVGALRLPDTGTYSSSEWSGHGFLSVSGAFHR